jgi:thioredoxin reductase
VTDERATLTPDVAIVGGGPAGLTAAAQLRRAGATSVLVLEREGDAGGIPRHSDHPGYGIRDLRTMLTGPKYARRLVERALTAGAEIRTSAMVTGWAGGRSLYVTSPQGRLRVDAQAVVLATGARERPRSARMIPGDRPSGVLTTGLLQNLVHLHHQHAGGQYAGGQVGLRAVVVGSELVSWSAVLTLREAGCGTVLMTTEHARPEAYGALTVPGGMALGVPVSRRTRLTRIIGRERVEAVEIMRTDTGQRRTVACDTVVLTGDWIPDNELARTGGLEIDAGHLGPVVDTALRTSADGVFAAGNLLHPVDTADVAALDGRHVAGAVLRWLEGDRPMPLTVRLVAGDGFAWVSPGRMGLGDVPPARGRLLLWPTEARSLPRVTVRQDSSVIARRTLPWPVAPGRVFRVPWTMLSGVRPGGGDVSIGVG